MMDWNQRQRDIISVLHPRATSYSIFTAIIKQEKSMLSQLEADKAELIEGLKECVKVIKICNSSGATKPFIDRNTKLIQKYSEGKS